MTAREAIEAKLKERDMIITKIVVDNLVRKGKGAARKAYRDNKKCTWKEAIRDVAKIEGRYSQSISHKKIRMKIFGEKAI